MLGPWVLETGLVCRGSLMLSIRFSDAGALGFGGWAGVLFELDAERQILWCSGPGVWRLGGRVVVA